MTIWGLKTQMCLESQVLLFYNRTTKVEQSSGHKNTSLALVMFFLLLFFLLLLTNNLCLDYIYGNYNNNNRQPLLLWHKWEARDRTWEGQQGQQGLKTWHVSSPPVCSFFWFFSTKCLFTADLLWWQWTATTTSIIITRMNMVSRHICVSSSGIFLFLFFIFLAPLNIIYS